MLDRLKDKSVRNGVITVFKFVFAAVLVLLAYSTTKDVTYVLVSLIELALIFVVYNLLVDKNIFTWLFGNLFFFVFIAQVLVLYFGNSYVTLTMLKNVQFLKDLGGRIVAYAIGVVLVLAIVFLRGRSVLKKINLRFVLIALAVLAVLEIGIYANYKRFSPVQSFATVFVDEIRYQHVKKAQADPQLALETYYRSQLEDAIAKPSDLPENPNIILIFTEGMSYNIISDERDITPNISEFESQALTFKNYYNHTFPTLRGVQGQLYSGYKLDDNALGNNLISFHGILKSKGYSTSFINVEPFNEEFNNYCANLGFDQVITDVDHVSGYADGMTDAESYQLLLESATDLESKDEPFLLSIYTFGTHVSFDSDVNQFGDGSSAELNKFHNLDVEFGNFLEAFKASDLAKDTIIVFTTDHCTYADQDYTSAFPDYKRDCTDVDSIPLFIYYEGIEHQEINVNGRNSLCLTPSLLDYLDINSENYFLGTSLFDENAGTDFDSMFYDASYLISTSDSQIRYLDDIEIEEFLSQVLTYYSAIEATPQ